MIQFENINKSYTTAQKDYSVLKNITFSVDKGEYLLITGKSGSGKSTLLNILTGVDSASSGKIIVNDKNIIGLNERELTKWRGENIGIIFQFFQLISTLSVLENILLPMDLIGATPKQNREKKAMALLDMVGMSEHFEKLPSMLSGGEQQRVAIARALANDVSIIIADEPTGNLDSKNAEMVFEILERLNKSGRTVIMVTHEKDTIKGAKRKIFIKDGEILEDCLLKEVQ